MTNLCNLEFGWDSLARDAYDCHRDEHQKIIHRLNKSGVKDVQNQAFDIIRPRVAKTLKKRFARIFHYTENISRTKQYDKIAETYCYYSNKNYSTDIALRMAIRKHNNIFKKLVDNVEADLEDSSEENNFDSENDNFTEVDVDVDGANSLNESSEASQI